MKMLLPVLAKRLLSFALALVLLLSLCPALPLTANAYEYTDGWVKLASGFKGKIVTSDEDMTYEDDEPYDWEVYLYQNQTSLTVDARATIYDENGNTVGGSPVTIHPYATKDRYSLMFSASDYTALTTDLEGTFTLKLEIGSKGTPYAQLEKTFTRVINDTPQGGNTSSNGWAPISKYSWVNGAFTTGDEDLIYEEGQAYDWTVTIQQAKRTTPVRFEAVIKDEAGNIVSSYSDTRTATQSSTPSEMFNWSNFSALTQDLGGMFTLTADFYLPENGDEYFGTLTQTFTRIAQDNNAFFEATSRSKPNKVFSYADPIDLVLNIKKKDAVEEGFKAVTTITNASGATVASGSYTIPSSTDIDVSVKDLVDVTNIKTAGNYTVNVTLNDAGGNLRYETTIPFAVVAMNRTVSIRIDGEDTYEDAVPTLTVYALKDDGVTENCTAVVTVIDTDTGNPVYSDTITGAVSGNSANPTKLYPNLDNLPIVGNFCMDVVVKDSEGITRATASKTFARVNGTPLTANLTDNITGNAKTGMIYADTDNPLALTINHPSSANKTLTVHCSGVYNGKTLDETRDITMPSNGTITLNAKDFLKYGIYENLRLSIYNSAGDELWIASKLYTFSLVVDSSSASMPLLNINDHFTNGKGNATDKLNLTATTGANMWRTTIRWAYVEKNKGEYSVGEEFTSVMDTTRNNGMQALLILAYNNDNKDANDKLFYGDPYVNLNAAYNDPVGNPWLVAYANYCYKTAEYMAKNYSDVVVGFEIWNEWNHASMSKVGSTYRTGAHYAMVVKAASEQIRKVNSKYRTNFKVIAGATAGDGYGDTSSNSFINDMFAASGFFAAVDGVSFHTYSSVETTTDADKASGIRKFEYISPAEHDFAARISNYQGLVNKYNTTGKDIEIWLTETGWTTNTMVEVQPKEYTTDKRYDHHTYGVTEQEQAAYLVQLYTWALYDGTLDQIFWYDFMNDISSYTKVWSIDMTESNYGLIHNWNNSGDQPLKYSAKQGYVAMCALNSKLTGATNGQKVNLGSDIHAYQFEKDDHYLMVVWTDDEADTTRTATLSGSIVITDMFGNATTHSNSATLELSECPIYLEYAKGSHPSIG